MEISPNVHWLSGRSSNLYLCIDESGLTLVDTGAPNQEDLVLDAVQATGRDPSDLTRIIITHGDIDHAGSVAAIQAATGATIYCGQETAGWLYQGKSPAHLPAPVQFIVDRFSKYAPVSESVVSICGEGDILPILGGLHVFASPGHTPDHHSFFSPAEGVLFAGDALSTRGRRLSLMPRIITSDVESARQSAIRLLQMAPAVIACGHGRPSSSHSVDDVLDLFNALRQSVE